MENCVFWQTTVRLPAWIISRLENNLEASMTKALHTERLSFWLEKKGADNITSASVSCV